MPTAARPSLKASRLGVLAVLTAVCAWSFTNVVLKLTASSALTFGFYRLWAGSLVMALVLAATGRRLTWRMIRLSVPGGILFGLDIAMFFAALKATGIADVLVIQALQPALILMVAGPLFDERITRSDVAWTLLSVGGVVLVSVASAGTPVWSLRGDVLAVGALLVWTGYFLVSKSARREVPATEYMTTVTLVAALVISPMALAQRGGIGWMPWQDWAWLAVFLVAAQGGHLLVAWAHAQVDVSVSSLLILGQPIISSVAAFFILGEPLTALEIVGGLVVVASVGAIVRRAMRVVGEQEEATPSALPA